MKILKFGASWCSACKAQSLTLAQMQLDYPLVEIDVDKESNTAVEFGVRSLPTLIIVDENENRVGQPFTSGYATKEQINKFIQGSVNGS